MPTYEYRCPNGHEFENFVQKMSDAKSELACPTCGAVAGRRMSAGGGFVFKGSGFYITDYGKDGKKDQRAAAAKAEGGTTEVAKSEGRKSEVGKSESGKSEGGKSESGRSESGRSESGQSESGAKSDRGAKPETSAAVTGKPAAPAKPASGTDTKPGSGK